MSAAVVHGAGYLDEDVPHARFSVAWVSLARHDANGLAINFVMIQILQALYSCTAAVRGETSPDLDAVIQSKASPSAVAW